MAETDKKISRLLNKRRDEQFGIYSAILNDIRYADLKKHINDDFIIEEKTGQNGDRKLLIYSDPDVYAGQQRSYWFRPEDKKIVEVEGDHYVKIKLGSKISRESMFECVNFWAKNLVSEFRLSEGTIGDDISKFEVFLEKSEGQELVQFNASLYRMLISESEIHLNYNSDDKHHYYKQIQRLSDNIGRFLESKNIEYKTEESLNAGKNLKTLR